MDENIIWFVYICEFSVLTTLQLLHSYFSYMTSLVHTKNEVSRTGLFVDAVENLLELAKEVPNTVNSTLQIV